MQTVRQFLIRASAFAQQKSLEIFLTLVAAAFILFLSVLTKADVKNLPVCNSNDIDVVITWVDGNDEAWKSRLQHRKSTVRAYSEYSLQENRFRDLNQLKYALRSIRKNVPFAKNIYIVTDHQVPHFLHIELAKQHKIFIVDHSEIFTRDMLQHLPVFNSYSIELNLHRIPNLSECFFYVQDDQFFAKSLTLDLYFNKNKIIQYVDANPISKSRSTRQTSWMNAWVYTHDMFCNKVQLNKTECNSDEWYMSSHSPQLYKKAWIKELEQEFNKEFKETIAHPFRMDRELTLTMVLFNHWAKFKHSQNVELKVTRTDFLEMANIDNNHEIMLKIIENLRKSQPVAICFQDSMTSYNQLSADIVERFYQEMLPQQEPWEIK